LITAWSVAPIAGHASIRCSSKGRAAGLQADDGRVSRTGGPRAERPRRRAFTPEFMLRMVAEHDRATETVGGAALEIMGNTRAIPSPGVRLLEPLPGTLDQFA
jgi:hypothetical protein